MINLILRNTPQIADCFELREIEPINGKNTYEVFCENGKIVICGDCKISMAMGYSAYLKKFCKVNFSHCGNTEINVTEAPLFEGSLKKTIKQDKRVYLNYRTFGYSLAFWQWDKWEKEIDFMAMNGINMPLSIVGTEAVWYYTLRDFKYSEKGALTFLSGPAFWPWQLTGNLSGYFSLTDVKYIESRLELGKKIIERERELGMTPIQQGFSGMVPNSFKKLFPKIKMNMVDSWCNFGFTFMINPSDPVFKKFGMALLEKQRQLFGSYHYYAADPLFESKFNNKNKNYLWRLGRAIDSLYADFDPDSHWVIQSKAAREQTVKSVPKERLLILDLDGEKHKETEDFWGYDFILGNTHCYGDRNTLHGSVDALCENEYLSMPENCVGTGLFPEGIYQNPLYYDLAFEMLTADEKVNIDEWLCDYAERRYGSDEECLKEAVKKLHESCYGANMTGRETASIVCARPCTDLKHCAPFDVKELRYDNNKLIEALDLLLSSEKAATDGYEYDLCDIARQALSNKATSLYDKAIDGFNRRDVNLFEVSSNAFLKLCDKLEALLSTRIEFSLSDHLKAAGAAAKDEKDKENYELNLLTQLTLWGPIADPVNYDYAHKEWAGLVGTYYSKRWQSFYELLAYRFPKKKYFSTKTKKQINERNLFKGSEFGKRCADFEKKWLSTIDPTPFTEGDVKAEVKNVLDWLKNTD